MNKALVQSDFGDAVMSTAADELVELTSHIVSAFVGNHSVRLAELPELIQTVHTTLATLTGDKPVAEPVPELKPAVPIKRSVTDDYIVCLDDGKKFKSLKRHLQQAFGMTPDDYRTKWGLPRDYPMVAPGYASKRSELARASGLGNSRRAAGKDSAPTGSTAPDPVEDAAPTLPTPVEQPAAEAAPRRRGRPRKVA